MKRAAGHLVLGLVLLAGLALAGVHSILLSSAIAEGFSVAIACTVFAIAWNARRVLDNHFFLLVAVSLLSAAVLDFVHMLSHPGMGVFPEHGANLQVQLWIAARFLEGLTFAVAPAFVGRRLPAWESLFLYLLVTVAVLFAVFTPGAFPECVREGSGPTLFRIAGGYAVGGTLAVAAILLFRVRTAFDGIVYRLVMAAILIKAVQETAFVFVSGVSGYAGVLQHFLNIVALWLVYLALIDTGLRRPYDLLFRSLKESEKALRGSEEQFRRLAEESIVGVLVLQDNRIRYANHRLIEMFGYLPEEVINRMSPAEIIVPEDLPILEENLRRRVAGDRNVIHTPYRAVHKDGSVLNVEVHSVMITYQGRVAIMGTVIDVTNHIRAQEAVRYMAYHDSLTGLPNRSLLQDRVDTALAAASRANRHAALMVLDLDRFKEVNDTLGHALGDQLLVEVSGRLRQAVRESDTVARLGGDEFVVFLPEIRKEKAALVVAEKIVESLGMDFVLEGHPVHTSASVGIARFPEDGKDGRTLLRKADEAMYRAKEAGGNRYEQVSTFQEPDAGNPPEEMRDLRADSL
ncbi:MAG TPA: MASE3 domain-containing protein [Syntrophales bacterium]|nr:MASE3 domain-containing protein [Syntrophales bacterium]